MLHVQGISHADSTSAWDFRYHILIAAGFLSISMLINTVGYRYFTNGEALSFRFSAWYITPFRSGAPSRASLDLLLTSA